MVGNKVYYITMTMILKSSPYFSVGGYSALIDFVLGLCCFSSSFSFLSCSLNISDRIPPGVRVLR